MIVKRMMACAFACVMALSLAGCAGEVNDEASAESEQQSVEEGGIPTSFDNVTDEELDGAYYLMASQMPKETTMTGFYIRGNAAERVVSATFFTTAEDGSQRAVADECESLLRLYSVSVANVALQAAQEAEDEDAIALWQGVVDSEEANTDGPGGLYEFYMAVATAQNDDGSLLIDGERAAGTDTSWNWQ